MVKKNSKEISDFFKQKKVQTILVIVLLLGVIFLGTYIRVQNLDLLEDKTTGERIPLALDPYYFLRVAETMDQPGEMPECDSLRVLGNECRAWHPEILPHVLLGMHKVSSVFLDVSLYDVDVFYPVIFFILSLIVYFLLVSKLTKSKLIALISSLFLTITPAYLYRTMAGFADHEAIGMFSFFLLLLAFSVSLKYFDNKSKNIWKKTLIYGLVVGLITALTVATWRGIANFAFMIIPLSVLIFWFVKRKTWDFNELKHLVLYYGIWFISSILIAILISGNQLSNLLNRFVLSSNGIISLFVLGFLIVDFLIVYSKKKNFIKINKKYEILISFIVLLVLGLILLAILGELSIIPEIFNKFLNPFGSGRVGETVAENQSPTLKKWMDQTGKIFFWIFILGMVFVGNEISKRISKIKKRRITFFLLFVLMIFGIIFSSHSSIKNIGFLKNFVYFAPLLSFLAYSVWLYGKENSFKISSEWIIVFSWLIFMVIAARGAVRLFFVITPFVCFMAGIVPVKIFNIIKKNKDELIKTLSWVVFVAVIIGLIISATGFYQSSLNQASQTGPSANAQWQETMEWVRENTAEDSLFTHWWDYGYWVETLGERATLSDGGHFQGEIRNHMIGRYVLTTPNPDSALSFMKSNNATHLLIDYTDIGKYGAYSRIGSGEEMKDRLSNIQTFKLDPKYTQETRNLTTRTYVGGSYLDEDLVYELDGEAKLFPRNKAIIGGIILETKEEDAGETFEQPKIILIYNNQQERIPVRYMYYQGEIIDFGDGIESTIRIVPSLSQSSEGVKVDSLGSAMYLSRKVSKSLVSQLFIMDDPFNKYEALEEVYTQPNQVVEMLKMQGAIPENEDFVVYGDIRGPIKIWKADNIPEDINVNEEFTQRNPYGEDWEYGMLDELKFRE